MLHAPWVYYIKNKMHTQRLESSIQCSVVEEIESDLHRQLCHIQLECKNYIEKHDEFRNESAPETHRLQGHESFLTNEARKGECQYHQEVTVVQKNLDTASLQSQDNLHNVKTLSDETLMLRKELAESGKLPQSMKDLTASEHLENSTS